MKSASHPLSIVLLAGVALLLAGCPKKPNRPSPDMTTMGPGGGNTAGTGELNPQTVATNPDLTTRNDNGFDANNQIRGKLDSVYFAFDSSSIKPSERPKLQAAKDYLDQHPEYRMLLEGHCDWRGTAEYNLALGDRRANEAKKYLTTIGVSPDRLDTLSKGSEDAVKNADKATSAKDRRVEFVLTPANGAAGAPPPAPAGGTQPPQAPAPAGATPPPPAS